jgi:hypothetical protein
LLQLLWHSLWKFQASLNAHHALSQAACKTAFPLVCFVVLVIMGLKFSSFSHRGPDTVTEELVDVLLDARPYEFKALFGIVHAGLRARNAVSGGEEMLRLRAYEKLQDLVRQGRVKKAGKEYKGVPKALRAYSEDLKALRKRSGSLTPKGKRVARKRALPRRASGS